VGSLQPAGGVRALDALLSARVRFPRRRDPFNIRLTTLGRYGAPLDAT
jgi:hypothetical protein